jgi:glycosyltransferase involved in cell wall biosynthesis
MAGPAEGEYAESLKQTVAGLGIESRVTWTGMLVGAVKWGALRAADVFILPSHQENFGIAVAEALACRLPVLISNKVNIWREIDADGAGLVEPDDTEGTYRLLKRWIDFDSTRREAMRSQSIKCYQKRFSIPEAGKAFIDALALLGA